ncbi:hypothetical protein N7527_009934 [Penicillium freii]|uniref:Uncharacterized protein n=1 Tax=Penicillium freii TaxID=48697 RepID=A0A101MNZ7_PENFR|nr:hypothetical protein N7527_009934 [Penicillium freii]KUM64062.1 hypothetical protein ACN42_g3038 [Penicillium freii]
MPLNWHFSIQSNSLKHAGACLSTDRSQQATSLNPCSQPHRMPLFTRYASMLNVNIATNWVITYSVSTKRLRCSYPGSQDILSPIDP